MGKSLWSCSESNAHLGHRYVFFKSAPPPQTQTAVTFVLIVLGTRDLDRDVRLDEAFLAVPNAPHITLTVPELFGLNGGGNALFGGTRHRGPLALANNFGTVRAFDAILAPDRGPSVRLRKETGPVEIDQTVRSGSRAGPIRSTLR